MQKRYYTHMTTNKLSVWETYVAHVVRVKCYTCLRARFGDLCVLEFVVDDHY